MGKICTRCVMTNSGDDYIRFDKEGICNYCTDALKRKKELYFPNKTGEVKLKNLIDSLKDMGKNKPYDCLMGISGGLDSSYLAYLGAIKWGLRIKAIHVDDGYDTEVSQRNIQKLVERCGIDLEYLKPDKKQFNELTRAYMMAGVPNLAVPQDNILLASIYNYARNNNISGFLTGGNFALECILQRGNTWYSTDTTNIKYINKRFGRDEIDKLTFISEWKRRWLQKKGVVVEYRPLNYLDYNRERALEELHNECGFEYYGSKHLENYLTGFLQLYWLPQKFGVDKRTSHLSSMIINEQITRDEALDLLKKPAVNEEWINKAIKMIKENMEFSDDEFLMVMKNPIHQHNEYKIDRLMNLAGKIYAHSKERSS